MPSICSGCGRISASEPGYACRGLNCGGTLREADRTDRSSLYRLYTDNKGVTHNQRFWKRALLTTYVLDVPDADTALRRVDGWIRDDKEMEGTVRKLLYGSTRGGPNKRVSWNPADIELICTTVRGRWRVEVFRWIPK